VYTIDEEKILPSLKRSSHLVLEIIYIKIKKYSIHVHYVPTDTSVATLQRSTHWLPTHQYALRYTLATPKNATHTKSIGRCANNAYIGV
jgi:hypothetical protein